MGQPPQTLVIVEVSDEDTALTGRSNDNASAFIDFDAVHGLSGGGVPPDP